MVDEKILVEAIRGKRKVRLMFHSKEDASSLVRMCAPMDVGPSRRAKDKSVRYHFWDFDSDTASHTLSLLPTQVLSIEVTAEPFDPAGFVSWDTKKSPWFIERDWGPYS